MIVVTGATGKLGRLVIDGLLPRVPAAEITAAVRDPGKAADFAERGVDVRRAAGRDIVYQNVPPEQYWELLITAGLPPMVADAALDTRRAIAEGEFAGTSAVLSGLIGRPTTPLADVVAAFLKN